MRVLFKICLYTVAIVSVLGCLEINDCEKCIADSKCRFYLYKKSSGCNYRPDSKLKLKEVIKRLEDCPGKATPDTPLTSTQNPFDMLTVPTTIPATTEAATTYSTTLSMSTAIPSTVTLITERPDSNSTERVLITTYVPAIPTSTSVTTTETPTEPTGLLPREKAKPDHFAPEGTQTTLLALTIKPEIKSTSSFSTTYIPTVTPFTPETTPPEPTSPTPTEERNKTTCTEKTPPAVAYTDYDDIDAALKSIFYKNLMKSLCNANDSAYSLLSKKTLPRQLKARIMDWILRGPLVSSYMNCIVYNRDKSIDIYTIAKDLCTIQQQIKLFIARDDVPKYLKVYLKHWNIHNPFYSSPFCFFDLPLSGGKPSQSSWRLFVAILLVFQLLL